MDRNLTIFVLNLNESLLFFSCLAVNSEFIPGACSSDNEVPCTDLSGELKSIGSYKFHAKSSFYRFVQKLHEFQVMVNMNDIYTYSIVEIFEQMKLFF
jgi:hypothetical protein